MHCIFAFIVWCLEACHDAVLPLTRFDGSAFGDNEVLRRGMAGARLAARFVCIFLKIDWGELPTLGFPTFASMYHPCFMCRASRGDLGEIDGFTLTYADLVNACMACEILVVLSQELHAYIRARLQYDLRKKNGLRGRVLMEDVPAELTGGAGIVAEGGPLGAICIMYGYRGRLRLLRVFSGYRDFLASGK